MGFGLDHLATLAPPVRRRRERPRRGDHQRRLGRALRLQRPLERGPAGPVRVGHIDGVMQKSKLNRDRLRF